MRNLLIALIAILAISCTSASGNLKSKVEMAQEQRVEKFRAKKLTYSMSMNKWYASDKVEILELDTLYVVGDTIETLNEMKLPQAYVLIN